MSDAVKKFTSLVTPWLPGYAYVSTSVFGAKEQGTYRILGARVLLLPPWSPPFESPVLDSKVFWGRTEQATFAPGDLEALAAAVDEGVLQIGGIRASLPSDPQTSPRQTTFYGGQPVAYNRDPAAARSPMLQKLGGSKSLLIHRIFDSDELEWHLRTLDMPFINLDEAYRRFGVPAERFAENSIIELSAYPPIEIRKDSTIVNGTLTVRISMAAGLDRKRVSVGYIVDGTGVRGRIAPAHVTWTSDGDTLLGKAELEAEDAAVLCFLVYGETALQQKWVVDRTRVLNKHAAIYTSFDPDFAHLGELLFDPKRERDARRFEDGVALLLNMLGFSVTQHGRSQKLTDGPDILAFTPKGALLVVECTTGMPDEDDQVAAIKKRVARIRRALEATGWRDVTIHPLIATPLRNADAAEHRQSAEGRGVIVLCQEDLGAALSRVRMMPDADEYLEDLLTTLRNATLLRQA